MKRLITAMLLLALSSGLPLIAQPTATDLSYFPLQTGNVWVYRITETKVVPPGDSIVGYDTMRVEKDTIMPNGKRYYMTNGKRYYLWGNVPTRIDSLTGIVYQYKGGSSGCPDSTEIEYVNLTIDSTSSYTLCHGWEWEYYVATTDVPEQAGLLDVDRKQRVWKLHYYGTIDRFAEGIGLCYFEPYPYPPVGWFRHELVYAKIDGVQYFPVTFRSFHADLLPGNRVHLRWSTEQEERNAGFTVQRRAAPPNVAWEDVGFVEARAPEGGGASYTFVDEGAGAWRSGTDLQYRLRQHDYDGTVSYSFVLDVRLSSTADSPELAAWPQPATDVLHLQLRVPAEHAPQLRISDMLGREVRLHRLEAGTPYWSWDLTDAAGGRVSPGLYLVSVRAGEVRMIRKVVVR